MLWGYQNLWHFSVTHTSLSMTVQFEDFKSEIVARLVGDLISFVRLARVIGTLITDFERGLFDGQLGAGGEKPEVASLVGSLQSVWLWRFAAAVSRLLHLSACGNDRD
jgi:hypothetical protein